MKHMGSKRNVPAAQPIGCLAMLALTAVAGCTAPVRVDPQPQDVVAGRQLYEAPEALIYASSRTAAEETARDLAEAARVFRKTTGRDASRGLVLVTDLDDPSLAADRMVLWRRVNDEETWRGIRSPDASPMTPETLEKVQQRTGPQLLTRILLFKAGHATVEEAVETYALRDRPAAASRWFVTVPTGRMVKQTMQDVLDKLMEQKKASAGTRAMVAPLAAAATLKAPQAASTDRQIAIYGALLRSDPTLAPQVRRELLADFLQRKRQRLQQGLPDILRAPPAGGGRAADKG